MSDTRGPGVHYPDGISGGAHPGPLADCRIPRCIARRIDAKAQQAAETALDQLAAAVREAQARHDAEVRAAAIREAAEQQRAHLRSQGYDLDCVCEGCTACLAREYIDLIDPPSTPEPTP